jgi:hypothetical protein
MATECSAPSKNDPSCDFPAQSLDEKIEDCMKMILKFCSGSSKFYVEDVVYNRFWEEMNLTVFLDSKRHLNFLLDEVDLTYREVLLERGTGPGTESVDVVRRIIKTIMGFVDEIWQYILRDEQVKLIAAKLAGELQYQTKELFEI